MSIYKLRAANNNINYGESSNGSHRRVLNEPSSTRTHTTTVLQETSISRIHDTVQIFLIMAQVVYYEKENIPMQLKRSATTLQGSSAQNPPEVTPSRKNHGRHTNAIPSVVATLNSDQIQEMIGRIEKEGIDHLEHYLNTVQREAMLRSPMKIRQIAERHFRELYLFKDTEFEVGCNRCESGLMDSNDFDRMVEFRIRPIWDSLVVELVETDITPEELTHKFARHYLEILTRLKERIDPIEDKLNRYFAIEKDPNATEEILELRKFFQQNYRTSQNVSLVRWRKDPDNVEEKERILRSARHVKEEANYQFEAASKVERCSIDQMSAIHFGSNPRQAVKELLTSKVKKRKISIDDDSDTAD